MESYRVETHRMRRIILNDDDAEINPVRTGEGGGKGESETGRLLAIIEEFNDRFGGIEWGDPDRVIRTATQDIPASVAKVARFENARQNSDQENARVESDKATERAVLGMVRDNTQLFKLFADNPDFRRWLADTAFRLAYEATDGGARAALRGRFSAPLATTGAGYFTLSDIPGRYRPIGGFRRVDLPASGSSAFQVWRRRSTCSARGSALPSWTPTRRPRRHW